MASALHPSPALLIRIGIAMLFLSPMLLAVPGLVARSGQAGDPPGGPPTTTTAPAIEPPRPRTVLEPADPVLGFALVVHHISDLPLYLQSIDRMAGFGANAINVVTPLFQRRVDSNTIEYLPRRCPTQEQLVQILRYARQRGMKTTLQPIVLIEQPRDKDWRGVIRPTDWNAWWNSYEQLIDHFLAIADVAEVDVFTIGSELNSTEPHVERWAMIATKVRRWFDGPITYAANWDRYDKVALWPLVDFISVSSYFELQREDPEAPEASLVEDWQAWRDGLLAFARGWNKPLMLGEVGYPSLPWASAHPWNYVAPSGTLADHEAQARCYRAFFATWSDALGDPRESRVRGMFCYHWDPYHQGQDTDTGYGIFGKPSEDIVRRGYSRIWADFARRKAEAGDPTSDS
ncbi:MAG: glycoside hydrolase family 113 [Planctomycetota bacterium]|jgi:hypothetical protein